MATPLADGGVHEMAAVVCLQYIVHRADVHCTLGDTGGGWGQREAASLTLVRCWGILFSLSGLERCNICPGAGHRKEDNKLPLTEMNGSAWDVEDVDDNADDDDVL